MDGPRLASVSTPICHSHGPPSFDRAWIYTDISGAVITCRGIILATTTAALNVNIRAPFDRNEHCESNCRLDGDGRAHAKRRYGRIYCNSCMTARLSFAFLLEPPYIQYPCGNRDALFDPLMGPDADFPLFADANADA